MITMITFIKSIIHVLDSLKHRVYILSKQVCLKHKKSTTVRIKTILIFTVKPAYRRKIFSTRAFVIVVHIFTDKRLNI